MDVIEILLDILPLLVAVYLHLPERVFSAPTTDCSKLDTRFPREGQPGYHYQELCSNICAPGSNPEYDILCWSNEYVLKYCGDYVGCINPKPIPEPPIDNFNRFGVPILIAAVIVGFVGVAVFVGHKVGIISKIRQKCRRGPDLRDRRSVNGAVIEVGQEMDNLIQGHQQNDGIVVNGQTARPVKMVEPDQQDQGMLASLRQNSPETKPKTLD